MRQQKSMMIIISPTTWALSMRGGGIQIKRDERVCEKIRRKRNILRRNAEQTAANKPMLRMRKPREEENDL